MTHTVRAFLITTSVTLLMMAAPSAAKNADLPGSQWQDARLGCLAIDKVSGPLPGSDECGSISGSQGRTGPITGYVCERQSTIGFFAAISESDNSIKPDVFLGTYSADAINVQYCTRISNDWPPEFNCETKAEFKKVSECATP